MGCGSVTNLSRCVVLISLHASNINFRPPWSQTAAQITGQASPPSGSALIFVPQQKSHCSHDLTPETISKKKKERKKERQKRKKKRKRGQINTSFPTDGTSRNPCWLWWQVAVQPLTHSGAVSHIRHAAARAGILGTGSLRSGWKQMSSFLRDVQPVIPSSRHSSDHLVD